MHCATSRLAGAQVVQMKAMTIRVALAFTVAQGQHAASTRCTPEAFNDSATSCLSEQRTPDQRVHGLVSDPLASWRGQLSALRKQYATEGFVVVSGLVSQQRQADAVSAAWLAMGTEGLTQDPETWPQTKHDAFYSKVTKHNNISMLLTRSYLAMAAALRSDVKDTNDFVPLEWYKHATHSRLPRGNLKVADRLSLVASNESVPGGALAMHVFPEPGTFRSADIGPLPCSRSSLKPHIDLAGPRMTPKWAIECLEERGWDPCCLPMRMSTMHYLTPASKRQGATLVWPRSHTLLRTLVASDPVAFAQSDLRHRSIYKSVGAQLARAGVFKIDPVVVVVQAGDVMFSDMMLVHAGSENHASDVRLAFHMKIGPRDRHC